MSTVSLIRMRFCVSRTSISQLFTTFSHAVGISMHWRFHVLPWFDEFSVVVLSCFKPSHWTIWTENITHTTGRLVRSTFQDNSLFKVVGQKTCQQRQCQLSTDNATGFVRTCFICSLAPTSYSSSPDSAIKDPVPLSNSVRRSDQLQRETSEADQWNRVFFDVTGPPHWFSVATDRIIGLSPKTGRGLKTVEFPVRLRLRILLYGDLLDNRRFCAEL